MQQHSLLRFSGNGIEDLERGFYAVEVRRCGSEGSVEGIGGDD